MDKPAAYMDEQGNLYKSVTHPENYTPLYKRREWVGLTPEEAKEISLANRPYVVDMVAALEARLKEKNT